MIFWVLVTYLVYRVEKFNRSSGTSHSRGPCHSFKVFSIFGGLDFEFCTAERFIFLKCTFALFMIKKCVLQRSYESRVKNRFSYGKVAPYFAIEVVKRQDVCIQIAENIIRILRAYTYVLCTHILTSALINMINKRSAKQSTIHRESNEWTYSFQIRTLVHLLKRERRSSHAR